MKIKILSNQGRYIFTIENNDTPIFVSSKDSYLVPSTKSHYNRPWKAYRAATRLVEQGRCHLDVMKLAIEDMVKPIIADISAEEMIIDHYIGLLGGVKSRAKGPFEDEDDKEMAYGEVKMIVAELDALIETIEEEADKKKIASVNNSFKKVIRKYYKELKAIDDAKAAQEAAAPPPQDDMGMGMPGEMDMGMGMPQDSGMPAALAKSTSNVKTAASRKELKEELLDEYAAKACEAMHPNHQTVFSSSPESELVSIYSLEGGKKEPLLSIGISGKFLNVNSIMPYGKLAEKYPLYSLEFYQKYWKPIVESIGHFLADDDVLIVPSLSRLPDITASTPSVYTMKGWSPRHASHKNIDISFRGDKKPIWIIESSSSDSSPSVRTAASKYIELEYMNSIVKCIDPSLESLYGRTGEVIQVMPLTDMIEIDVDFGRGIDTIRLDESKIEIVPLEV